MEPPKATPAPSLFPAPKTGVESAKEWFGTRSWMRGTNASERFGDGAAYLFALHADSKAIDTMNAGGGPSCELKELLHLAEFMADVRRALDGWETLQGIRALEAATDGTTIQSTAPAPLRRGEHA